MSLDLVEPGWKSSYWQTFLLDPGSLLNPTSSLPGTIHLGSLAQHFTDFSLSSWVNQTLLASFSPKNNPSHSVHLPQSLSQVMSWYSCSRLVPIWNPSWLSLKVRVVPMLLSCPWHQCPMLLCYRGLAPSSWAPGAAYHLPSIASMSSHLL